MRLYLNINMDIKALRTPTHTITEFAAARAGTQARAPRPVATCAKPNRSMEPVTRDELWHRLHAGAVAVGHPEPERFADSASRARGTALIKKSGRAKVQVLTVAPKPPTAVAEAGTKHKVGTAPKCQAKTLEGRPCGFSATCGRFCKKHAPLVPVAAFQLITDRRRFNGAALKGYLNASPALVTKILGRANGTADQKVAQEWLLVFSDGTPAAIFFRTDDPALHVCGETVEVLGRVRQLLGL